VSDLRDIADIVRGLGAATDDAIEDAILDADAILHDMSVRRGRGDHSVPAGLDELRRALITLLERDHRSKSASGAVWVLGKFFDPALEPFFARIVAEFVDEPAMGHHLFQALIALDNLERLSPKDGMSSIEWEENRAIARAYLATRR
jgi:hypothetical protein